MRKTLRRIIELITFKDFRRINWLEKQHKESSWGGGECAFLPPHKNVHGWKLMETNFYEDDRYIPVKNVRSAIDSAINNSKKNV